MAILATAQDLSKSFGARPLFDGVSFTLGEGERVGLIGPNGAGKTTLLRILAGADSPDRGELSLRRGLRVGHVAQVPEFRTGRTVRETILEGAPIGDHDLAWRAAALADELISRLDLGGAQAGADAPVERLSGGWRKRVALARELVREPELLLLDEPTNHLDVDSILWLEKLLAAAPFATVTVTHDRLFLQRVANRILELDRRNAGGLLSVDGDYATFIERKADLMAAQERREVSLRNTLRRETEWLRAGAPARTTKQQARIQRADALAGEVDELASRNVVRTANIDFAGTGRNPRRFIEARGIAKSYGDKIIFKELDLFVGPGSRVGLIGPNGCGKSTLLRVLVGDEPPDAGQILRADGLQVAYFAQHREALDPSLNVVDTLCPGGDHVTFRGARVHVSGYLARFLFRSEHSKLAVGQLSGGEQSRLAIARLMLRPANVLVLDEPTNDLDMDTLQVLEVSLLGFEGAVLLVTHDRYFLDRVTNRLLAFHTRPGAEGRISSMVGLTQWEAWHAEEAEAIAATNSARPRTTSAASVPAPRRKLSYIDQREWDSIEARIAETEARLTALRAEQDSPEVATNHSRLVELEAEIAAAKADVDRLYVRWAELESLIPR
ncbi:MAG: ABC-F family ATP-binding cassette domain-containing protein [Polyangia bacterium]